MIYLVANKRGFCVRVRVANRTYRFSQRTKYAVALLDVAYLQDEFPDAGVAILGNQPF